MCVKRIHVWNRMVICIFLSFSSSSFNCPFDGEVFTRTNVRPFITYAWGWIACDDVKLERVEHT
jgi:hypothetical protein